MIYYFGYLRHFTKPLAALVALIFVGSGGFHVIEGWDPLDCVYMTVITITTVGFSEVHPLSSAGRVFTMFLLLGGGVFYALSITGLVRTLVENRFGEYTSKIRMKMTIERLKDHYIICGGGRMAHTIASELEQSGMKFVIIENNPHSIVSTQAKWPIIVKDALLEESLIEARIADAAGLAAVLPTDADNLFIVLSARQLNPTIFIQTRITYESSRSKMVQAGASKVVSPYTTGGLAIARSFTKPEVEELVSLVRGEGSYEFDFQIHRLTSGDPYCGQLLRNALFREQGYIVIGIRFTDGRMKFAPDAAQLLSEGMEVFLLGAGPPRSPEEPAAVAETE